MSSKASAGGLRTTASRIIKDDGKWDTDTMTQAVIQNLHPIAKREQLLPRRFRLKKILHIFSKIKAVSISKEVINSLQGIDA